MFVKPDRARAQRKSSKIRFLPSPIRNNPQHFQHLQCSLNPTPSHRGVSCITNTWFAPFNDFLRCVSLLIWRDLALDTMALGDLAVRMKVEWSGPDVKGKRKPREFRRRN